MNNLLIIGCGDVALRTIPLLRGRYRLYALVRNPALCSSLRRQGVTPILADLDEKRSLARITGIADVVLHFAPPLSPQKVDTRTRHLLAALSSGIPPRQMIYISTSGVYGDCGGSIVSEVHPVNPLSMRAQLRVNAEQQIRTWASRNRVRASILRVPGIYAEDRLPLERINNGSPAIVAEQDGYSNHVHADDLARIIMATIQHGKPNRVYHAVDDDETKMGDYFDVIADAFQLPRPVRLQRSEVKAAVSPMMWSFMNESRRLSNTRMKRELKVKLRYPTPTDMLTKMSHSKQVE